MTTVENGLCSWCESINPCGPGKRQFPQNRTDTCPEFPDLLQSSRNGCQFCGLLRIALLEKYSKIEISKTENDWDDSVKATWPATTDDWDHQVTIRGPGPRHKENWKDGDRSHVSLDLLSLTFWPYPPRNQTSEHSLFFTVHADASTFFVQRESSCLFG